jgi:uncharacterized protein (DUF2237 family)|tara:strand:+ start:210 stop:578 length:369 start_codon:yes stop_codon:yes gene_type:complete
MQQKNVFGDPIEACCYDPITGYFRDGFCRTDAFDQGSHTVCASLSAAFLDFSKRQGNDLTTPRPAHNFPGLKSGQSWCLCASRWLEAEMAGCAPRVFLRRSNMKALDVVPMALLKEYALDLD